MKKQEIKIGKNNFEEKYQQALADYQNLIKRSQQQQLLAIKYANQELVRKLLPLIDDLENAVKHSQEPGIKLVLQNFFNILAEANVTKIEAKAGEKFDPSLHECIEKQPGQDGIILKPVRLGFQLEQRVIRPAQVIVGKEGLKNE